MSGKKILATILCALFLIVSLTGCTDKEKTKSDISADLNGSSYLPVSGLTVSKVEITQRRTDKKAGTDLVYVDVIGNAGDAKYCFSYIVEYLYFDKGGWVIQNAEPYQVENWTIDTVSDSTVKEDVAANDLNTLQGINIKECSLISESSDPVNAVCRKSMRFIGECESYSCEVDVTAFYELTAEGWLYCEHYYDAVSVVPRYGVEASEAENYVESLCGLAAKELSVEADWDHGVETHFIETCEEHPYLTVCNTIELRYFFDPYMLCWLVEDHQETDKNYDWDVIGTWYAEGIKEDRILYPDGFPYRIVIVVTQEEPGSFRVDYDLLNPIVPWTSYSGKKENEILKGTVYVDAEETYSRDQLGMISVSPEWQLLVDLPDTQDQLKFHEETGVSITHYSWDSFEKELTRIQ